MRVRRSPIASPSSSSSTSKAKGAGKKRRASSPPAEGDSMPQFSHWDPDQRKPRKRTTKAQQVVLEKVYETDDKPCRSHRDVLALELGPDWTQRDVQVWFQNRRAKTKKQKEKERARRGAADTSIWSASDGSRSPDASTSPQITLYHTTQPAPSSAAQNAPIPPPDYRFPFGASQEPSAAAAHAHRPPHEGPSPPLAAPTPGLPLDHYRRGSMPALRSSASAHPPGFNASRRLSADRHTLGHVRLLLDHPWASFVRERNGELLHDYGGDQEHYPDVEPAQYQLQHPRHSDLPRCPDQLQYLDQQYPDQAPGPLSELDGFKFPLTTGGFQDQPSVYAPDGGAAKRESFEGYSFTDLQNAAAIRRRSIASDASTLFSESSASGRSSTSAATDDDMRRAGVSSTAGMFAELSLQGHVPTPNDGLLYPAYDAQLSHAHDAAHAYMQYTVGIGGGVFTATPNPYQNAAGPSSQLFYDASSPDLQPYAQSFDASSVSNGSHGYYLTPSVAGDEWSISTPRASSLGEVQVPIALASYHQQFNDESSLPQPTPPPVADENAAQWAGALELRNQCVPMETDHFTQLSVQIPQSMMFVKQQLFMTMYP